MQVQILMRMQDDPKKCTAAKLVRFGLARRVGRIARRALVLDPFAARTILPSDRHLAGAVAAIDCSWSRAGEEFPGPAGMPRRLPPLLAGNPTNYSRMSKLSTAEALSAALFILGYGTAAAGLLDKFRWGHTFYELNRGLLEDYSRLGSESEIGPLLEEYGIAGGNTQM